jgi:hypothetical protein
MFVAISRYLVPAVFSLTTALRLQAQAPPKRVSADSCLSVSEFQLRGVFLGTDTTGNLTALGKVLRVRTDSGVDDGGRYERRTLSYRGVDVAIVRGAVDELIPRSRGVATPSGLAVGLGLEEVHRILLNKGVRFAQGADTVDIGQCESDGAYITLAFDAGHHVRRLDIYAARP